MTPTQVRAWAESMGLRLRYDAALERLDGAGAPFIQLAEDHALASYAAAARLERHGFFKTQLHRFLRFFLSDFDINGYLGTYPMHVLSAPQWEQLLSAASPDRPSPTGTLLDVGSGRGDVLGAIAQHFAEVTCTETSHGMARRLRKLGYEVLESDVADGLPDGDTRRFDAISLLNVLDRCDRPLRLLGTARTLLKPGGLLIIALVLPYGPFVYEGGQSRAPRERLPISSREFEDAAVEFVQLALRALGFEISSLSRAPYLSGGDNERPLYELDDLIVVCKAVGDPPPILGA